MTLDPLELVYFTLCAVVAIAGAIGTVAFPNPIRGALSLLFTLLAVAGLYLQLQAPLLAAIQLIVYVGAVVVLFLFVIMLLGPAATAPADNRGLGIRVLGGVMVSLLSALIVAVLAYKAMPALGKIPTSFGTVSAMGDQLFGPWVVPFEAISFLLMVAIVGAVAVARGRQPDPQARAAALSESETKPAIQSTKAPRLVQEDA